jgi:hypothetical protein
LNIVMNAAAYRCPACSALLARQDTRWGAAWLCAGCEGIGLNTSVLKRSKPEAFGHSLDFLFD